MLSPDRFESGIHALIGGFGFKIPSSLLWVFVDVHGVWRGGSAGRARDRAIRLIRLKALCCLSDFEIPALISVLVRLRST
jgi:hypothetical protein